LEGSADRHPIVAALNKAASRQYNIVKGCSIIEANLQNTTIVGVTCVFQIEVLSETQLRHGRVIGKGQCVEPVIQTLTRIL
jgi:hypothetical protein